MTSIPMPQDNSGIPYGVVDPSQGWLPRPFDPGYPNTTGADGTVTFDTPSGPTSAAADGNVTFTGPDEPPSVRPGEAGADTELPPILGDPAGFALASGRRVRLRPLATLELFALVRVVTTGLGPAITELNIDPDEPDRIFAARMAGLTLSALPNAGHEAVAFLRSMVEPVGLAKGINIHKADRQRNQALQAELEAEMVNPDPMDTIEIVERIWQRDAGNLQALGKRLAASWRLMASKGISTGPSTSATSPA